MAGVQSDAGDAAGITSADVSVSAGDEAASAGTGFRALSVTIPTTARADCDGGSHTSYHIHVGMHGPHGEQRTMVQRRYKQFLELDNEVCELHCCHLTRRSLTPVYNDVQLASMEQVSERMPLPPKALNRFSASLVESRRRHLERQVHCAGKMPLPRGLIVMSADTCKHSQPVRNMQTALLFAAFWVSTLLVLHVSLCIRTCASHNVVFDSQSSSKVTDSLDSFQWSYRTGAATGVAQHIAAGMGHNAQPTPTGSQRRQVTSWCSIS